MKNLKNRTKSTIIIFLAFTVAINLSTLFTSVNAGPFVPEEHAYNGWHWGVDVGDELYWEVEMVITNASNIEVIMMFRDIWIYNITSIENVTTDWLGVNEFSLVNATQYYFNVTEGELESYGDPSEFAMFGFNSSDTIEHKYRAGMGAAPYILPLNGSTNLEVDVLDDILSESFYDPLSPDRFNQFDGYSSNTGDNSMTFTNSSDDYYLYLEYGATDGVAEYAEGYMLVQMDGPMLLNFTIYRVLDYDITDEIEWGVNIGDVFYYDWTEGTSSYCDVKVEITNFADVLFPKSNNGFMEDDIPMVFQCVYSNLSVWNGTAYEIEEVDLPIGYANNFYFQYVDESFSPEFNFVYPNSTTKEDIEFMWNPHTLRIWDAPFNDLVLIENTNFEFTLRNTSTNFRVNNIIDKSTGIVQSFLITEHGEVQLYYEIKYQTLIDWDLEIGDAVYYKQNSQDGGMYIRATMVFTDGEFVNLTQWEIDSGGIFTKVPGDPELQFFKALIAEFEEFDEETGTWNDMGDDLFLEANVYWPISPYAMFGGTAPPLFVPLGFTGEDFENLLSLFGGMFDEMTFTEDHVLLKNSTNNKEYDTYLDITTGRISFMGGWMNMPGGDDTSWMYMSIYPMYNHTLNSGMNSIPALNDVVQDATITLNIRSTSQGVGVVNALTAINPVNASITNGTALFFDDLLITNTSVIENISFYIKFDDTFNLVDYDLIFWGWNMSGDNKWDQAPPEVEDYFIYNYEDNSLTIDLPLENSTEPFSIIIAVSYVYTGPLQPIPGYPMVITSGFLLVGILSLVVLQLRKTRKNTN